MTLLELQRRMAEDVRRPLTADFEMRDTTDDGASVGAIAASYISPNDRLSSFERLEIYNRQYWFRLISAVSEDFPTLNPFLAPNRSVHFGGAPGFGGEAATISRGSSGFHRTSPSPRCRCREARVGICRRVRSETPNPTCNRRSASDRTRVQAVFAAAPSIVGTELSG